MIRMLLPCTNRSGLPENQQDADSSHNRSDKQYDAVAGFTVVRQCSGKIQRRDYGTQYERRNREQQRAQK